MRKLMAFITVLLLPLNIPAETKIIASEKQEAGEPVIVVTSYELSQGTGCYATLFQEPGFRGKQITVFDGVDIPEMKFSDGSNWTGKVKSIIVGPKARLILYGQTFWKDRDYTIAPSTRIQSIETYPWNDVESLQLKCVP